MGRKKNEGSAGAGRICFSTIKVLFYCTVPVQEAFLIFTCVVLFLFLLSLSLFVVVVVAIFILVHHRNPELFDDRGPVRKLPQHLPARIIFVIIFSVLG
jgi:hypothetical protein